MNFKFTTLVLIVASDFIFTTVWGKYSAKRTAKRIEKRYNASKMECSLKSGKSLPAYMCSGILIRGVNNKLKLPHAWSMKPLNKKLVSFALAYLRKDTKFDNFPRGYDSGFIIYPHLNTPKKKEKYKILCAFPLDAHTDDRKGSHGCGRSKNDPSTNSDLCNKKKFTTFKRWKKHFRKISSLPADHDLNTVTRQCGFDMTKKKSQRTFKVFLQANKYIMQHGGEHAYRNNELRMHIWNEDKAEKIPIEAFFFLSGSQVGRKNAVQFRADFKKAGGGDVPIVQIQLPSKNGRKFRVLPYRKKKKSSKSSRRRPKTPGGPGFQPPVGPFGPFGPFG